MSKWSTRNLASPPATASRRESDRYWNRKRRDALRDFAAMSTPAKREDMDAEAVPNARRVAPSLNSKE